MPGFGLGIFKRHSAFITESEGNVSVLDLDPYGLDRDFFPVPCLACEHSRGHFFSAAELAFGL